MWVPPVGRAPPGPPLAGSLAGEESAGAGGSSPPLRARLLPPPGEPGPGPASWRRLAVGGRLGRGRARIPSATRLGRRPHAGRRVSFRGGGGAGAGRERSAASASRRGLTGRGGASPAGAGLQGASVDRGGASGGLCGSGRGFRDLGVATSFLLLNLQFSGLIKAMNGIYFSLLASVHLHNNGFLFLQNKIIPGPLSVSRVSDSIAPMPVNCCRIVESLWFGFESWLCHSCVILHNLLNLSEPQSLICKTGIVIPIQDWYEKD